MQFGKHVAFRQFPVFHSYPLLLIMSFVQFRKLSPAAEFSV
jgi:hypothetical protein